MLCLMAEFNGAPLKLVKDPRICLLLDLWLPALEAAGTSPAALLVLRPPNEIADSLAAREDLPAAISAALFLRYMLAAELATRGGRRHIVEYDDLLRDWRGTLDLAGARAGITLADQPGPRSAAHDPIPECAPTSFRWRRALRADRCDAVRRVVGGGLSCVAHARAGRR